MREFLDREDYDGFYRYRARFVEEDNMRDRQELQAELASLDASTREKILQRVRQQTNPDKNTNTDQAA